MAKRLAAFHYYTYQQHGQDALGDRSTREGTYETAERIAGMVAVTRSYARMLESAEFDDVREELKESQYWHGFKNTEEAFKAGGDSSDFFIPYDIGNWFIHAVNVDYDFVPAASTEGFTLKALTQRDPKAIQMHLANAMFRYRSIIEMYVDERGLHPELDEKTTVTHPDGTTEELGPVQGIAALMLSEFQRFAR